MDAPCRISQFWGYPVVSFLRNGQNMALLCPKHGPNMVSQIDASLILIDVLGMICFQLGLDPYLNFDNNVIQKSILTLSMQLTLELTLTFILTLTLSLIWSLTMNLTLTLTESPVFL